jgi:hypothetical protein
MPLGPPALAGTAGPRGNAGREECKRAARRIGTLAVCGERLHCTTPETPRGYRDELIFRAISSGNVDDAQPRRRRRIRRSGKCVDLTRQRPSPAGIPCGSRPPAPRRRPFRRGPCPPERRPRTRGRYAARPGPMRQRNGGARFGYRARNFPGMLHRNIVECCSASKRRQEPPWNLQIRLQSSPVPPAA